MVNFTEKVFADPRYLPNRTEATKWWLWSVFGICPRFGHEVVYSIFVFVSVNSRPHLHVATVSGLYFFRININLFCFFVVLFLFFCLYENSAIWALTMPLANFGSVSSFFRASIGWDVLAGPLCPDRMSDVKSRGCLVASGRNQLCSSVVSYIFILCVYASFGSM